MKAAGERIINTSGSRFLSRQNANNSAALPPTAAVDRVWKELIACGQASGSSSSSSAAAAPLLPSPPPTPMLSPPPVPPVAHAPAAPAVAAAAAAATTTNTTAPSPPPNATAPSPPLDSVCEGYSFDTEGSRWVVYEPELNGEGEPAVPAEWWVVPEDEAHRCLQFFINQPEDESSRQNILEEEFVDYPAGGRVITGRMDERSCGCDRCSARGGEGGRSSK